MASSEAEKLTNDKPNDTNIDKDGHKIDRQSLPPASEDALNGPCSLAVASDNKVRLSATTKDAFPPPYSHNATESPVSPAHRPPTFDGLSPTSPHQGDSSLGSDSTCTDLKGVRVRTKGNDLKSGFPYHPCLYDLRVRPDDWQRFSDQVTNATKLTRSDHAKAWAAAGGMALTGHVLTSAWVGRSVNRTIQEKKVSSGLTDNSEDSLGGILQQWNQSYFAPLGLQAKLELSDSAMRKDKQQSSMFRRPSLTYRNREERERRNEDRKYVIVVTEIVGNSRSTEAHELVGDSIRAELPVLEETPVLASELPGGTKLSAVELPTIEARAQKDSAGPVCQIAELPADIPVQVAKTSSQRTDPTR